MGVKDKTSNSPQNTEESQKNTSPPHNSPRISVNSKRTFEEFKQSIKDSASEFDKNIEESEGEEQKYEENYEIYEQIDCRDSEFRWLNAEITAVNIKKLFNFLYLFIYLFIF